MKILCLQETDWLTRGPHTQHHLFERLSKNPKIKITVLDYDIDKKMSTNSLFVHKHIYENINRVFNNNGITVIRTAHIQIPYLRRISSLTTNFFEILKIIRKNRPDVIFSFSMTNGILALFLAKLFHIPFIFYYIDLLHTLIPIKYIKSLAYSFSKFLFFNSDLTIVVTEMLFNSVINEGVPQKKIKLLLNGVSLENTKLNKEKFKKLKKSLTINDDDFVICFMGYLYSFAGLKEIIDYYNNDVNLGNLNLKFLIIGDGEIYGFLVKYIESIKANWVILTGKIPFNDLAEYVNLADLCLLSFALNEITKQITPIKVMEYMAMKKPVLSTSLPSVVREIGRNNGVIFAEDQQKLIKMIGELSNQKQQLKEIGVKGYNLIKEKYQWSKILRIFKATIIELIKIKNKK